MEKFTPLAKIIHCRRQWRHRQIPPLLLHHLNCYTWHYKGSRVKYKCSDHQSENKKLQMNCIYSWTWQLGQLKSVQGLKWKQPSLSNVKPLRAWLNQLAGSADVCTTICWFTPHFLRHFNFTAMAAMSGITPWGKTQKQLRISEVTPPPLQSFLSEKKQVPENKDTPSTLCGKILQHRFEELSFMFIE